MGGRRDARPAATAETGHIVACRADADAIALTLVVLPQTAFLIGYGFTIL
jgi:hypothetical protein